MEIRPLVPEDAEAYLSARLEALRECPSAFASSYEEEKQKKAEKYRSRFKEQGNASTYGAFEQSELVGMVTLVKSHHFKLRHRATLVALYVKSEKRGMGIGKKLVLRVIEEANKFKGIEQLNLSVVTHNEVARQLYHSVGFEGFGIEKNALKSDNTYYDEEHMVLFLKGQ